MKFDDAGHDLGEDPAEQSARTDWRPSTIVIACCRCRGRIDGDPPKGFTGPDKDGVFWRGNTWQRFICKSCSAWECGRQ